MKPTVTVYQNETNVMIIFSKVDGTYHGSTTSFENSWSDGGSCGLSGFDSRKELNKYLKENNYKKKGISIFQKNKFNIELEIYCWSKHVVESHKGKIHGGTATCFFKKNHKGKHTGSVSGFGSQEEIAVNWK